MISYIVRIPAECVKKKIGALAQKYKYRYTGKATGPMFPHAAAKQKYIYGGNMKIAGIIAEYNPFHHGHAYQIRELKSKTGADYVIAAMSGDFVQRGAPAVMDKYARAKMALSCGIDLVLELPSLWSASSAPYFAESGVLLFDRMHCIDYLCFGAETENLSLFYDLADLLVDEPPTFSHAVTGFLKQGLSYPLAAEYALKKAGVEDTAFLSSPNNILALEYIKALRRQNSPITPYLIKRSGAGYHDRSLSAKNPSASAIRSFLLRQKTGRYGRLEKTVFSRIMPDSSLHMIDEYQRNSVFLSQDDFSAILYYALLSKSADELSDAADLTPEIANRLKNRLPMFQSFSQFTGLMKSRNVTYARMSRILLHIMLGHTKKDYARFRESGSIPYLRILGLNKTASPLLSVIKKSADIPLISKASAAKNILSANALALFQKDIYAADLYEQVKFMKSHSGAHTKRQAAENIPLSASSDMAQKIVTAP